MVDRILERCASLKAPSPWSVSLRPRHLPGGQAHAGTGPALTFCQRAFFGRQWGDLCRAALGHEPLAAAGTDFVAYFSRSLGGVCPLRHSPFAAGTRRFFPLQRAPTKAREATRRTTSFLIRWPIFDGRARS